ncbi:hypothetical protein HMPREF3038_00452 [Akkermansia sp. KLE1797]|nr:hypothetical protein HMPREF3038_00452 [Akkermansia sp. KLE1797]KXU55631.1 hypothetical protein HMPREF3039_00188 [Akkermansia sp. KLE1798]KZA05439.1 hypothetical protein HMPREF1326_00846 [Akkermansia sp. KLE1605]
MAAFIPFHAETVRVPEPGCGPSFHANGLLRLVKEPGTAA